MLLPRTLHTEPALLDLIAVAWTDQACEPAELISAVCGAVGGVLGNCIQLTKPPTEKPHGRLAVTLIHPGFAGEIDLSIIPPAQDEP
jgi:hypothetical protein